MSDRGKSVREILKGVDLLGFVLDSHRPEADQDQGIRAVTAKVGKNDDKIRGIRAVTAKVGKPDDKIRGIRSVTAKVGKVEN